MVTRKNGNRKRNQKKYRDSAIGKGIPVKKKKDEFFYCMVTKPVTRFFVERLIHASFQMPLVTRILPENTS